MNQRCSVWIEKKLYADIMWLCKVEFGDKKSFNTVFLSGKKKAQGHVYKKKVKCKEL